MAIPSLIWTEIKFLLPWWAVTVATSYLVLLATPASEYSDYPLMCLGLGCALLAAQAFSRAIPPGETDTSAPEQAWTVRMSAVSITSLAAAAVFSLISAAFRASSGLPTPLLAVVTLTPALGIVPYLTMRTGKPFAAVVLAAFIVGLIKIASCIVVRIVYGADAQADGYMAGDWQTAKLMISLFWIGTVTVSVVSAAACRYRFNALLTAAPPGSGLAVALYEND